MEYTKNKDHEFIPAWIEEYDMQGNKLKHIFFKDWKKNISKEIVCEYDTLNRIVSMRSYSFPFGKKRLGTSLFYSYQGDSIKKCKYSFPNNNDTIIKCQIIIATHDSEGNTTSKRVLQNNPWLGGYDVMEYHWYKYEFDSIQRKTKSFECTSLNECTPTNYYYNENYLTIRSVDFINYDSLGNSTDTIFLVKKYKHHNNDSIASVETFKYSSSRGESDRLEISQKFNYDEYGNVIRYEVISHSYPKGKRKDETTRLEIDEYTYDENGNIVIKTHKTLLPKNLKETLTYKYFYEYW